MFPRKWFRYPCIAVFALSDMECCLPRAGRMIGKAALEGTSLNKSSFMRTTTITRKQDDDLIHLKHFGGSHLFLALSSWCKGIVSSSASSSSCTTGVWSPTPRFWSHSLTLNIMFPEKPDHKVPSAQSSVRPLRVKIEITELIYMPITGKRKHRRSPNNVNQPYLLLLFMDFFNKCTFLQCKVQIEDLGGFLY